MSPICVCRWPPQNPFSTKPIGNGLDLGLLQVLYVPAEYGLILQPLMVIIANFHLSKATIDGTRALKATYQVLSLSPTQTPTLSMAMNLTCHVHRLGQHNLLRSAHHKGPSASESYVQQQTAHLNQYLGACAPCMVREHSAALAHALAMTLAHKQAVCIAWICYGFSTCH